MSFARVLSPNVVFLYQSKTERGFFRLRSPSDFIFLSLQINGFVAFVIFLAHFELLCLLKWKKHA